MSVVVLLALFAAPFWEAKPPAEWSDQELKAFLNSSPWVQVDRVRIEGLNGPGDRNSGPEDPLETGVRISLASAQPVREAEQEWRKRHPPVGDAAEDAYASEFYEFMNSNPGKYIALAMRLERPQRLEKEKQTAELEKRCELRIGKRRYKLVGHFLPSPGDPYLRLIFPRELKPEDEALEFTLYLPGIALAHRQVTFALKQLTFKGNLEL